MDLGVYGAKTKKVIEKHKGKLLGRDKKDLRKQS